MVRLDPELERLLDEDIGRRSQRARLGRRRRRRSLRRRVKQSCCLFLLIILIGLLVITLAAVAKTGIWEIPVFSRFFYQLPEPARTVRISDNDQFNLENHLALDPAGQTIILRLPEVALTTLLRQTLSRGGEPMFGPDLQAAITPAGIELFGFLLRPIRANLTAELLPVVDEHQLVLIVNRLSLGNLLLPPFATAWLNQTILSPGLSAVAEQITAFGVVESVQSRNGELIISGQLETK